MIKNFYDSRGVNTYISPLDDKQDGVILHAVNVDSQPIGAKTKRIGYASYLNNPDNAQVNSLWSFALDDGSTFFNYRASGSLIYYSAQGTGNWTICGNGTISNGAHVGHAVLSDTMIVGDGVGSTRHTTDGTSFTNTTLAPIAAYFTEYQGRIHAQGTNTNFYSSANDATNWNTSGTSDSSSIEIPGGGRLLQSFKVADRLVLPKTTGEMYRWDGYSLVDLTTKFGPSTPYAYGETEGYKFYINRYGHFGYGGSQPELLSNAVQRQFYNASGSAIVNNNITTLPAETWYYDYLASVGTITDDFTDRTITNALLKYDFQKNEYLNWQFADQPTAFHASIDSSGFEYLYFGDSSGNTYRMDPQTTSDDGEAINSELVFFFHFGAPYYDKVWRWYRANTNPGCQARAQVATSDVFEYSRLVWHDLGDLKNGFVEYRFPDNSRSKFLFIRIYEAGTTSPWTFYGQSIDAEVVKR